GLSLALELRDSTITYRSRYLTVLQPAPALDLVLADEDNPRALAFQLVAARELLSEIAEGSGAVFARTATDLLEQTRDLVRSIVRAQDQERAAMKLGSELRPLEERISALSDRIARQFFDVLPTAHAIGLEPDSLGMRGAA
ncbi:MAG: alpha-E domain-containing protein, partial [Acetobacteraceae bacterium]|nr:alpha-E domain-containing protein [Acetobacteraceae bacterium]